MDAFFFLLTTITHMCKWK